jgi:hypothetical protein
MPSTQPDDAMEALLAETRDVKVRGREYERGGVVFAARPTEDAIELKLGAEIADAAIRTPGTTISSRGSDWILLRPGKWSDALDRLEAWYRVAWRLAGKRQK